MSRRNALPPLPRKYRVNGAVPEEYGFRTGAFLLSLAFLIVGLGLVFSPAGPDDALVVPLGIACVAVFAISAVASGGWRDRPFVGLRRMVAELQFIAMGIIGIAAVAAVAFVLARLLFLVVESTPSLLIPLALVFGLLVLLARRWHVGDLMGVRIGSRHVADIASTALQRGDYFGHGRS